jgi:2-keto-3-deoxy-L-rhamnonate aldolase RhmA
VSQGGVALGSHCFSGSPTIVEAAAAGGLDFVVVDTEHALNDLTVVAACTRAAQAAGADAWVRLARIDADVGRLLDFGVDGLVLSRASASRLQQLISEALYAPEGRRGACPAVRAGGYAVVDWAAHAAHTNAQLWIVPLVEDRQGVADAAELAACPHVRALFVGAFDLAADLGEPNTDLRVGRLGDAFAMVVEAAASQAKPLMVSVGIGADPTIAAWLRGRGVRLFSTGADVQAVRAAAVHAQSLRAMSPGGSA